MMNTALFVKSKDSKDSKVVFVLSRNKMEDHVILGEPFRRELQSYYDGLVWNGIISFVTTDTNGCSLFKIKGIEELQKIPSEDLMTIEDLLVLAATTNNIDYPHNFENREPTTTLAQDAACIGASLVFCYAAMTSPTVASTMFGTALATGLLSHISDRNAERPEPKF